MSGHQPWAILRDRMSAESRQAGRRRADLLLAQMDRTREARDHARKALALSRRGFAEQVGLDEAELAATLSATDRYIHLLRDRLEAAGGELNLQVRLAGQDILLSDSRDLFLQDDADDRDEGSRDT